jgi:hypothetical protein
MKANSRLKPVVTGLVAAAIVLSLNAGSVVAHESQYDNSRPPHESPHKAEPPTGGHKNLANAATNPIANLIQFQVQNQYNWENNNSSGYSNEFLLQPVIPIKTGSEKVPLLITRTTIPWVTTPNFGSPEHRKHGVGDTTLLVLGIPNFGLKRADDWAGYLERVSNRGRQ